MTFCECATGPFSASGPHLIKAGINQVQLVCVVQGFYSLNVGISGEDLFDNQKRCFRGQAMVKLLTCDGDNGAL